MKITFTIRIIQSIVDYGKSNVSIELTESEALIIALYSIKDMDEGICLAIESAFKKKSQTPIYEALEALNAIPKPGPKLSGFIDLKNDMPKELISFANNNPIFPALIHYTKTAEEFHKKCFIEGIPEIIK